MSAHSGSSHSHTLGNQLCTHNSLLTTRQFAALLNLRQKRAYRWIHSGMLHLRMRGRRSVCECLRMKTSAAKQAAAGEVPASAALGKLGKHIAGDLKSGARGRCAVANPDKYAAKVGESRMTEAA